MLTPGDPDDVVPGGETPSAGTPVDAPSPGGSRPGTIDPRRLADQLNHLIPRVHPPDRGPYTDDEIAAAVGVSADTVRCWRAGQDTAPPVVHVEAMADFFALTPAYFFDDDLAAALNAELELLLVLRDSGVCGMNPCAGANHLAAIKMAVDWLRRRPGAG